MITTDHKHMTRHRKEITEYVLRENPETAEELMMMMWI
jgi:hypothetical protein